MSPTEYLDLSSRERQIMEIVFRRERATVADIRAELPDAPTPAAIRTMLSRLESKGHLEHEQDGLRNVYFAAAPLDRARQSTLQRMMRTFFDGSPVKTVAAILDEAGSDLPEDELDELAELVERARRRGR